MITYQIKDWDRHYENNRTREMKTMSWVPVPTKHDGLGYNRLVGHRNGAARLGAWLAILQVAAKCEKRGTLLRGNRTPLRAGDIAAMARLPESIIAETLTACASSDIGWIEIIENEAKPQEGAEKPQEGAGLPQVACAGGNRTEQNRTEQNTTPLPPRGSEKFDEIKTRISALYNRRPATKWSDKEDRKLKEIARREDALAELAEIEAGYPTNPYRRRDIGTLLNNWTGELDRTRNKPPEKPREETRQERMYREAKERIAKEDEEKRKQKGELP